MSDAARKLYGTIHAGRSILRLIEPRGHFATPTAWLIFTRETASGTAERGSAHLTRLQARELKAALDKFLAGDGCCITCLGTGEDCDELDCFRECSDCGGTGEETPPPCPACRGSGVVKVRERVGVGMVWVGRECQECKGGIE